MFKKYIRDFFLCNRTLVVDCRQAFIHYFGLHQVWGRPDDLMKSTVVDESLSPIYNQSSVTEKTTYVLQETTKWEIYTIIYTRMFKCVSHCNPLSHQISLFGHYALIWHLFMIVSCIETNEFKAKAITWQAYVYKGK